MKADPGTVARLKAMVKRAGGNKAVAERSGVKLSTLNNYLRSATRLPAHAATQIADACGVTVEWLLTGREQDAHTAGTANDNVSRPENVETQHAQALVAAIRPVLNQIISGKRIEGWLLIRLRANLEFTEAWLRDLTADDGQPPC